MVSVDEATRGLDPQVIEVVQRLHEVANVRPRIKLRVHPSAAGRVAYLFAQHGMTTWFDLASDSTLAVNEVALDLGPFSEWVEALRQVQSAKAS